MKLGFGLYRHQLDDEHLRFARQCGATHLVVHYTDYFRGNNPENRSDDQPTGGEAGWGQAGDPLALWSAQELSSVRERAKQHGLVLHALENIDPAFWYDVLLGGPERAIQLEGLKQLLRNMAAAKIPVLGYYFSLAGVAGRIKGPFARGGAESVGLSGAVDQTPIPNGMVWNMVYEPRAPSGFLPACSKEELLARRQVFLDQLLPVAEEVGVTLAAHPDDPPVPIVRGTPRLITQPADYRRLIEQNPSPSNGFEYCLGTLGEMPMADIYAATEDFAREGRITYVHCRNVKGKVPHYAETFLDDGDLDVPRLLRILDANGFDGVIIPDHTPLMSCGGWAAGMAYAMGYLRRTLDEISPPQP